MLADTSEHKIEIVDRKIVGKYEHLVSPANGSVLQQANPQGATLAFGCDRHDHGCGLILGYVNPVSKKGGITSIYVARHARRNGIGSTLLRRFTDEAQLRGCNSLHAFYLGARPSTPILKHLFETQGWDETRTRTIYSISQADGRRLVRAPWMRRPVLPAGFAIEPWSTVSEDELALLQTEHLRSPLYDGVWPVAGSSYDHDTTVVLRHHGQLIGWFITVRVSPNLLRYERLFVRPEYRKFGLGTLLIIESVHRHQPYMRSSEFAGWMTNDDNAAMLAFIERGLASYITRKVAHHDLVKHLGPPQLADDEHRIQAC